MDTELNNGPFCSFIPLFFDNFILDNPVIYP